MHAGRFFYAVNCSTIAICCRPATPIAYYRRRAERCKNDLTTRYDDRKTSDARNPPSSRKAKAERSAATLIVRILFYNYPQSMLIRVAHTRSLSVLIIIRVQNSPTSPGGRGDDILSVLRVENTGFAVLVFKSAASHRARMNVKTLRQKCGPRGKRT